MTNLNKINGIIEYYLFYSFLLIIPSLVLGPAIPDFIIISSSILFFLTKLNSIEFKNLKIYFIYFFIFYFLLIFSSILSENQLWSLKSSVFYIRFFLYFIVVYYLINKYDFIAKYLFFISILILLILFVDALFQVIFKKI